MSEDLKVKNSEANTDGEAADLETLPEDTTAETSELALLRQELGAKEAEAKNNYDRFLRQVAEFENLKRRSAREREDLARFANEGLIKDLLPIVDNLERAVAHASGGGNGKPIIEGVEMTLKGLLDVLAKYGVSQISATGETFDPSKHEAIAQVESDTLEANTVVEELHKGYSLHDRLLRPALVSVAKAAKSQEKKNGGNQVENDPTDD